MPAPGNELNTLLAPRFLFQFAAPIKRHTPIWSQAGVVLDESCRLPDLASLDRGTPSSERRFADVRMAWAPEGLALTVTVTGKRQAVWCRESRLDESDGLQVWIDTRATHNIHRASKYCHRFGFLSAGGGRGAAEAAADQLLINRARENARPVRPRELQAIGRVKEDGYHLMVFIPAGALGGYDPDQHDQLGFHYEVIDRELGVQTFANGREFPTDEDPSCWATLRLER
ncbi:hypothetical protein Pla123a_01220 [Posidoniimonas polymericola]|uniref:Carbohydrate-binding domain-containing protein n=1 Tax=Posidoniimonas polymericola TaxID=2528002 RepID=A0A5C5ZDS5_9BACT|nr:hypothetical protein [Posidoniimonas polymericola]TWT85315.1 hypothetical protein Pla123a_01220 [Posidoniimonas polymericola]